VPPAVAAWLTRIRLPAVHGRFQHADQLPVGVVFVGPGAAAAVDDIGRVGVVDEGRGLRGAVDRAAAGDGLDPETTSAVGLVGVGDIDAVAGAHAGDAQIGDGRADIGVRRAEALAVVVRGGRGIPGVVGGKLRRQIGLHPGQTATAIGILVAITDLALEHPALAGRDRRQLAGGVVSEDQRIGVGAGAVDRAHLGDAVAGVVEHVVTRRRGAVAAQVANPDQPALQRGIGVIGVSLLAPAAAFGVGPDQVRRAPVEDVVRAVAGGAGVSIGRARIREDHTLAVASGQGHGAADRVERAGEREIALEPGDPTVLAGAGHHAAAVVGAQERGVEAADHQTFVEVLQDEVAGRQIDVLALPALADAGVAAGGESKLGVRRVVQTQTTSREDSDHT
jgi:hypothetical protein